MAVLRLKSAGALQRLVASSKKASRSKRGGTSRAGRTPKPKKPLFFHQPAEWRELSNNEVELILPIRLTNENNGRTKHFGATKRFRDECGNWCKVWFHGRPKFDWPVRLQVVRVLAKRDRRWDQSSIGRGNWKEIEDSLVAAGVFPDDSPKWITHVDFDQDASHRGPTPFVRVRIIPVLEARTEP